MIYPTKKATIVIVAFLLNIRGGDNNNLAVAVT